MHKYTYILIPLGKDHLVERNLLLDILLDELLPSLVAQRIDRSARIVQQLLWCAICPLLMRVDANIDRNSDVRKMMNK